MKGRIHIWQMGNALTINLKSNEKEKEKICRILNLDEITRKRKVDAEVDVKFSNRNKIKLTIIFG